MKQVSTQVFSMTGFASLSGIAAAGRTFSLAMKSVNHRHLDLQLRLPHGFDALEADLRKEVKAAVRRGHVELTLGLEKDASASVLQWNEALLASHVAAFRSAAEQFGITQEPDLGALLRLPGMLSHSSLTLDVEELRAPLVTATVDLLRSFNEARAHEGGSLAHELRRGMERMIVLTTQTQTLRQGVAAAEFAKLKARLHSLLGADLLSDERLFAEAALLATRSDIEEELVRLRTHVERFLELLKGAGELGRQLDFLLQEMNREANTLLSKTGGNSGDYGLRLTELGLQMKVELERAREQVQNLE